MNLLNVNDARFTFACYQNMLDLEFDEPMSYAEVALFTQLSLVWRRDPWSPAYGSLATAVWLFSQWPLWE